MRFFCFTIFVTVICAGLALAQHGLSPKTQEYLNRRFTIIEENDGLATVLDNFTNETRPYRLHNSAEPETSTLYADTTFVYNLWDVDTTLNHQYFDLIGTVPLHQDSQELLIFDSNSNGINELIGISQQPGMHIGHNRFYEYDPAIADFLLKADFGVIPEYKGGAARIGKDIDRDGLNEVYFQLADSLRVYEAPQPGSCATKLRHVHYPIAPIFPSGVNSGDFDNDGIPELLTTRTTYDSSGIFIGTTSTIREHISGDTLFNITSEILYPDPNSISRYAIGDIDMDGKTEYFMAGLPGKVWCIENVANDSFRITWQAQLPTKNAYHHFSAGDLDRDGLPEVFLGGDQYENGFDHSRLTALERSGDNQYHATWAIDIVGGAGLYGHKVAHGDIDGDGIDEFAVDVGGFVLLFKVVSNDRVKLLWAKRVTAPDGITMGDVTGDGLSELVISTWPYDPVHQTLYSKAYIYKYNNYNSVKKTDDLFISNPFKLLPNFPNPFNQTTSIRFYLTNRSQTSISVFNILGEKIVDLVNIKIDPGFHSIKWDGMNENKQAVSSGIYFLCMQVGWEIKTNKIVIIR